MVIGNIITSIVGNNLVELITGRHHARLDWRWRRNAASFGFVVITAPDEMSVSLDKRDGSPWEVMDCVNTDSEDEQTVRLICTDDEASETSLCHKIHLGHGVPGTILQMPDSCGPGKYAVAKDFRVSDNQELPEGLSKRDLGLSQVYDLTYDYDFRRVPRSYGDSKMRLDFSNEKGYWDSVVDRPGNSKRKRDSTYHENPKRWLEEEWREAYHFGGLYLEELHKRWFGESAIAWLANLIGVSEAEHTEEFTHSVKEKFEVILIDQQFGPCPVGPAQAQANLRATMDANLNVDTSFGVTIIATFGDGEIDLSDSYLFFKNKGEVTAKFQLDAVASLTYRSGDVKLFGLDDFPGATFRVPGKSTPPGSIRYPRLILHSRRCDYWSKRCCLCCCRCSIHRCRSRRGRGRRCQMGYQTNIPRN